MTERLPFPSELPEGVSDEAFNVALLAFLVEMSLRGGENPMAVSTLSRFVASIYGCVNHHRTAPVVPMADVKKASSFVLDQFARYQDMVEGA